MIVSKSKKIIFTRGVKTASTSFATVLKTHSRPFEKSLLACAMRKLPGFYNQWPFVNFYSRPHLSMAFAKKVIPETIFLEYYKFGVVRDPVSRMASIYKHVITHWETPPSVRTFEDFIHFWTDFRPHIQALQFIDVNGNIVVDELGRFECLHSFFEYVADRFELDDVLPRANVSSQNLEIEVNKKTRTLIEHICQIDYEIFDFDNIDCPFVSIAMDSGKKEKLRWYLSSYGGALYDPWSSLFRPNG